MQSGGPLEGVNVLDLSRVLAGPYATMALGELGADVIKIEREKSGDETRQWGPPFVSGESAYFLSINRNKRSLALDLSKDAHQLVVRDLALHWADVVVENFKPGTLEHWNLSLESLRRDNPRLITASVRGYPVGDDRPGYDFVIQAGSGLMSLNGPPSGEPFKVGLAVSDITTGLFLLSGIEAALYRRELSGRGDHVGVSLWESQMAWLTNVAQSYLMTGEAPGRYGNAHPQLAPYETFQAADGFLAIGVGNDGQFRRLCAVLQHAEWCQDARYATNPARVRYRKALVDTLQAVLKEKSVQEWVQLLEAEGIPSGPVRTIPEALEDAAHRGQDMVKHVRHARLADLPLVQLPWHFQHSPISMKSPPPTLDEHHDEIMTLWESIRTSGKEPDQVHE